MDFLSTRHEVLPFVRREEKTLDVRVKYPSNRRFVAGMSIELKSSREAVGVRILAIREYASLDEVLTWEDFKLIVPIAKTAAGAKIILEHFCPRDKAEYFGLIVIQVELLAT